MWFRGVQGYYPLRDVIAAEVGHIITFGVRRGSDGIIHSGISEAYDYLSLLINYVHGAKENIRDFSDFGKFYIESLRDKGIKYGDADKDTFETILQDYKSQLISGDPRAPSYIDHNIHIARKDYKTHGTPSHQIGAYIIQELLDNLRDDIDRYDRSAMYEILGEIMGKALNNKTGVSILTPQRFIKDVFLSYSEYFGGQIYFSPFVSKQPKITTDTVEKPLPTSEVEQVKHGGIDGSTALTINPQGEEGLGGIDLSQIDLTLKDQNYISSLNPAERKILLAAKYLKEGWNSLSLLYVHEVMLLLKDNLVKDLQNKNILWSILNQLQIKDFLDPQAQSFFKFLQTRQPLSEMNLGLYK